MKQKRELNPIGLLVAIVLVVAMAAFSISNAPTAEERQAAQASRVAVESAQSYERAYQKGFMETLSPDNQMRLLNSYSGFSPRDFAKSSEMPRTEDVCFKAGTLATVGDPFTHMKEVGPVANPQTGVMRFFNNSRTKHIDEEFQCHFFTYKGQHEVVLTVGGIMRVRPNDYRYVWTTNRFGEEDVVVDGTYGTR